jgi:hypothetical protein
VEVSHIELRENLSGSLGGDRQTDKKDKRADGTSTYITSTLLCERSLTGAGNGVFLLATEREANATSSVLVRRR